MNNRRIYGIFTLLSVLFIVVVLSFYLRTVSMYVYQARNNGLILIDLVAGDLLVENDNGKPDFQSTAIKFAKITGARLIIINKDSKLLADSWKEYISGIYYDSVLSEAKKGETSYKVYRSPLDDTLVMSIARPPVLIGDQNILIEVVNEIPGVLGINRILFQTLCCMFFILLIGIIILIDIFNKRVKTQMKTLLESTERAMQSGLNNITVQSSSEEVGKLVEHFNTIVNRYNNLVVADNKKYSRINTVFSSIGSGIIALDSNNKISMVNSQAESLLNIDKADLFSSRIDRKVLNPVLVTILEHTESVNKTRIDQNFSIQDDNNNILDVTVTVINNKYIPYDHFGVLAVIVDVTEMRRLENLRSEFISNVSHELRTPLTLIGGFVETLKNWNVLTEQDRNRSLDIIEIETDRLKRLISELLLLSKIESKIVRKHETFIQADSLVLEVIRSLMPLAEKKGIEFVNQIDKNIPHLKGVDSWFRQIIVNLCENAIKYTPEGGRISVEVGREDQSLLIKVKDNGIGIPLKDQEKIFERFYRVDKSRNSRIGGSGLGLAIARHIANEFGGDILLESKEGEGSDFTVSLPFREEN
ncbi:MAG: ATP-binding protein [Spirochaetaceae bacterium]